MNRALSIAAPIALIAVLLALWEASCRLLAIPVFLLPPPSAIGAALLENWPVLLASAWTTLSMAIAAGSASSTFPSWTP